MRTARDLAEKLEVSTRTIWRDIADLQAQGVPIDGERGVGYILRPTWFLPPLALTHEEMEALRWGVHLVETFGDNSLAQAARELEIKIAAVSPPQQAAPATVTAFTSHSSRMARQFLENIRKALKTRCRLEIVYRSLADQTSNRIIRPLGLEFWGHVWTLTAWCETKDAFRVFRCDRLIECRVTQERFDDEQGKTCIDFVNQIKNGDSSAAPD